MRSSRPAIVVAALLAFSLAGCSQAIDGTARAAAQLTPTTSDTAEDEPVTPSDEPETSDAVADDEPADEQDEAAESDESRTPVPPIDPIEDDVDLDDDGAALPDIDVDLDGQSVAWIGAWCAGVTNVLSYAAPDTTGMTYDATIQTIVDAYSGMSDTAAEVGYELDAMPQPTFAGAEDMTYAVVDWLFAVHIIYGSGAEEIATTNFSSSDELMATIDSIESGMEEPNDDLGAVLSTVDPAVGDVLDALPECAVIGGS